MSDTTDNNAQPSEEVSQTVDDSQAQSNAEEYEFDDSVLEDQRAAANHTLKDLQPSGKKFVPENETIPLPSANMQEMTKNLEGLTGRTLGTSASARDWLDVVRGSQSILPLQDYIVGTLDRDGAHFTPEIQSEIGPLRPRQPPIKPADGTRLSAASASLRVRSAVGLGTVWIIPLWHSGIWITVKAPREGELLELLRQITEDKISLGRATYGLMFSSTSAYTASRLMEFILQHVTEHSVLLPTEGDIDLTDVIRVPDLALAVTGLAQCVWSNGFQYARACIANPHKCDHIVRDTINVDDLVVVDERQLTPRQIAHMTKRRRGNMTLDSIQTYVDDFVIGQNRSIELTPRLKMQFKTPTVKQYIAAGDRWVSAIEKMYVDGLGMDETKRDNFIIAQGKSTELRQYAHYIQSITLDNLEMDGEEHIDQTLSDLSESDEVREKFFDEIKRYINDSMVAVVAVPNYKCPACGKEQLSEALSRKRFPNLIPIDPIQTFFTLLAQKTQKIQRR